MYIHIYINKSINQGIYCMNRQQQKKPINKPQSYRQSILTNSSQFSGKDGQNKMMPSIKVQQKHKERTAGRRAESPFDRHSGPKPNADGYWSEPLQLLKLRVRVLGCCAEDRGGALTRRARLNEIQGEFCFSSAEQSLAQHYSYTSVGKSLMNVSSP